jgi:hypothetical protein
VRLYVDDTQIQRQLSVNNSNPETMQQKNKLLTFSMIAASLLFMTQNPASATDAYFSHGYGTKAKGMGGGCNCNEQRYRVVSIIFACATSDSDWVIFV